MKILLDVSEFQSLAQLDQLLRAAPDEIVGVYIKATQGAYYRNHQATQYARICSDHNTPFGYYAFVTNEQAADQAAYFSEFVQTLPRPGLLPMVDAEPPYTNGAAGVQHFIAGIDSSAVVYADASDMQTYDYASLGIPRWVAQYPKRPITDADIAQHRAGGYVAWQFTDSYAGFSQDASVLLGEFSDLLFPRKATP